MRCATETEYDRHENKRLSDYADLCDNRARDAMFRKIFGG
jgi:hypothetical protein